MRLKLRGANGSPSTASTRAVTRGGGPDTSHSTRSPVSASFKSAMAISRRSFLSTGREPEALALLAHDSEHQLGRALELLHRVGDEPLPFLLGAREHPVADPERTAAAALEQADLAAAACRRAIARAPPQTLPPSSTSAMRSTVTLGTPPILWKARPGAESISPSSAMSLSRP